MRYSKLVLLLLAFAGALIAADPFVGTWKLNAAKTKFKTGMAPKEQTVSFSEEGSDLHVMVKGTSPDGKAISVHFTVPTAGGTGKIIESPYEAVSSKSVNANERDTSFSKGGKVVYTAKAKRAADGKTMTVAVKGTNPSGQTVEGTAFYDKQ
ncbi:MAG: hypothetical protein DMG59_11685 [Acidobacteria bacterium]|jgi:hypothetical protein|nr:MAG: hypothetical protein DMG59_11685 [Acidobacteriota bacterium]